jgi:hypothetical protein
MKQPESDAVYEAVERWVDHGLRRDDSLLTPGRRIWARGPAEELYEPYNLRDAEAFPASPSGERRSDRLLVCDRHDVLERIGKDR